jgi:hypothetical protein
VFKIASVKRARIKKRSKKEKRRIRSPVGYEALGTLFKGSSDQRKKDHRVAWECGRLGSNRTACTLVAKGSTDKSVV